MRRINRNDSRDSALTEGKLVKPFHIPRPAGHTSLRNAPIRKKRKMTSYAEYGVTDLGDDSTFLSDNVAGVLREKNIYPVYKPKEREETFKKAFAIPFIRKRDDNSSSYENRIPPTLGMRRRPILVPKPLYDPAGEFAIVLYDLTIDDEPTLTQEDFDKAAQLPEPKDKKSVHKSLAEILGIPKVQENEKKEVKVPIVLDPRLSKVLRPHQIEGVKFLYNATTGRIEPNTYGCIMADEMGLGKTLQCITLLWTLLKQSPIARKPTIDKCIIVCPSSLVKNWANELVKWLGKDTLTPLAVDGKATKAELIHSLQQWCSVSGRQITRPVLIVSYETLRLYSEQLNKHPIGLMLCDEGHRLKNGDSLTFTALTSLKVERRVILSGTPIQNDLSEYFSLLNFANPGYLGTRNDFKRNFENSILKGRDADATEQDRIKGDEKLQELSALVQKFIIRRTNDILSKYLPVKYEHVVFCRMSDFQIKLYKHFVESKEIKKLLRGVGSQPLKAIGMLKKLCNHPDLLNFDEELADCESLFPPGFVAPSLRGRNRLADPSLSGKMLVLERMLARIRQDTNDKIVLISNYTQTLDLLEKMCRSKKYGSLRLDGTMNVNKRQKLVDKFNDPDGEEFIFLLSSKAGGCGINLIGANRLILFDPDWNPAADQQALARVWRDGQKKDCFVYRFIATGSIEEKIFQRQSHKQSLSSCVVDEKEDVERHFSLDGLRQLFEFREHTICDTHDTFKCKRCQNNVQVVKSPALLYGDTSSWNHFTNECLEKHKIQDLLLRQESGLNQVSYVFQYISH